MAPLVRNRAKSIQWSRRVTNLLHMLRHFLPENVLDFVGHSIFFLVSLSLPRMRFVVFHSNCIEDSWVPQSPSFHFLSLSCRPTLGSTITLSRRPVVPSPCTGSVLNSSIFHESLGPSSAPPFTQTCLHDSTIALRWFHRPRYYAHCESQSPLLSFQTILEYPGLVFTFGYLSAHMSLSLPPSPSHLHNHLP